MILIIKSVAASGDKNASTLILDVEGRVQELDLL